MHYAVSVVLTLAFGQAAPTTSPLNVIEGEVVAIADGDTFTLLDAAKTQHKIRPEGIDAPESKQAFGTRAACCRRL
jgi:endonuclease YncB( thermonuclease family)